MMGGIDDGEAPCDAALRELEEEAGTRKAEIIAESREWFSYDLPESVSWRRWDGQYRGQTQRWFAMRFVGEDGDIRLNLHKAEFSAWRWVPVGKLVGLISPMKREVYRRVLHEFAHLSNSMDGGAI